MIVDQYSFADNAIVILSKLTVKYFENGQLVTIPGYSYGKPK